MIKHTIAKRLLQNTSKQGLEREAVRVDSTGALARTPHPKVFGSPLANPLITLDYANAQLEFVTPPLKGEAQLSHFLQNISSWSVRALGSEMLWPFSMPPRLPLHGDIPLADFGTSADAELKRIYREGLKQRYGGAVQTISGIHYNFSLSDSFWSGYARASGYTGEVSVFQDREYFALMRNVVRFVPLVTYLFGASPVADKSFFQTEPKQLQKIDANTYAGEYATSLRLSDFGYHNTTRSPVTVSFNSLDEYLRDLYYAISTPSKVWSALGVHALDKQIQLNTNILQLENEFYASIRPKQKKHTHPNQSVLCSLACGGVEYVELRSVDLDPYEASGIGEEELRFLEVFMLYCLFEASPRFKEGEQKLFEKNNSVVALLGRMPNLSLYWGRKEEVFAPWALKTLERVRKVAVLLDEVHGGVGYHEAVMAQREKILNPEKTPSARILHEMQTKHLTYRAFGSMLAKKHKKELRARALAPSFELSMQNTARASIEETSARELYDAWILKGYEDLELSTQMVIRAAKKRGIAVAVLDRELNVVELQKGKKVEVVKQGTISRLDTYLSYEVMKDKSLTKLFLDRAGIATPQGGRFTVARDAVDFYVAHRTHPLVVKPATTNYGTGVSIVGAKEDRAYERAVHRAFEHDSTVLVEEFIPGKEYRFLVIGGNVVAVLNRDPANVVGDGTHTIRMLVKMKNADPLSYKLPKQHIQLGVVEREILAEIKMTPDSVPKEGEKVYLRRNSNVSDGGDPIDVSNMPEGYKRVAIKAVESVGAHICGVDMILTDIQQKPTSTNHAIIELNWNPALYLHGYPIKGKARDVGGAVLDFLGF